MATNDFIKIFNKLLSKECVFDFVDKYTILIFKIEKYHKKLLTIKFIKNPYSNYDYKAVYILHDNKVNFQHDLYYSVYTIGNGEVFHGFCLNTINFSLTTNFAQNYIEINYVRINATKFCEKLTKQIIQDNFTELEKFTCEVRDSMNDIKKFIEKTFKSINDLEEDNVKIKEQLNQQTEEIQTLKDFVLAKDHFTKLQIL